MVGGRPGPGAPFHDLTLTPLAPPPPQSRVGQMVWPPTTQSSAVDRGRGSLARVPSMPSPLLSLCPCQTADSGGRGVGDPPLFLQEAWGPDIVPRA